MLLPALLSCLTLIIWLVLRYGRGGFWRVSLPRTQTDIPSGQPWPTVVAIVPARNEADVIGRAVTSLLTQDYPGRLRVVLIDDHSDDGTADAARHAAASLGAQASARLEIVGARALPRGWSGKVWAQSEGIEAARRLSVTGWTGADGEDDAAGAAANAGANAGANASANAGAAPIEWFWLTDADIVHPTHGLRDLVLRGEHGRRDMVSLMVRLRCESFAERMLIPAFVFFFAKLYPFQWIGDDTRRTAGAAGGCILLRESALTRIGGMACIKGALIDDCSLAAAVKRAGTVRLDLADAALSIRPYEGWNDIWRMIARTAYTQLHYSPLLLAGATLGMVLTYLAPPLLTIIGMATGHLWALPAALAWLTMALCYRPMLRYYGQSPWWGLALPLVAAFYMAATLDSGRRHMLGTGGHWKGRAQSSNVVD